MSGKSCMLCCVFLAGICCSAGAQEEACRVKETGRTIIVTTPFFALTFTPRLGGGITAFHYHGKELTAPYKNQGALLQDHFAEIKHTKEFMKKAYQHEILASGPDKVSVHLWARGKAGQMQFIEIHKTVTVFRERSLIRVDYEIKNQPESMTDLTYSPWSHNFLGVAGEPNTCFFPTGRGVIKVAADKSSGEQGNYWVRDVVRGWTGLLGRSGVGVVGIMDYRYLKNLYNWFGPDQYTVEWMYGPMKIPCGGSWKTTIYFMPVHGLPSIDGATKDMVVSLTPLAGKVEAKILACRSVDGKVVLQSRRLPGGEWWLIEEKHVLLMPDNPLSFSAGFAPAEDGTYAIRLIVTESNREIGEAGTSWIKGKSSAAYVLKARDVKRFKEEPRYVPFKPSRSVVTPHIPWAKPYVNGKVKGLFIVRAVQLRDVLELAQRMPLEFVNSTIAFWPYQIGWYSASTLFSKGFKEIEPLLNAEYDFFLISGSRNSPQWRRKKEQIHWTALTEKTRKTILEQVKKGKGLIYVYPLKLEGLIKELFEKSRPVSRKHWLLAGIPSLSVLTPKNVKIAHYGKGKILFLCYAGACLTPSFRNPPPGNYWEYYYSFLAKCVYFVTNREPGQRLLSVTQDEGKLHVRINSKTEQDGYMLQWQVLDPPGEEQAKGSEALTLRPGMNEVTIILPKLKRGKLYANLFLKTPNKSVADWFTRELVIPSDLEIGSIVLEKPKFKPGEPVKGKVLIHNHGKESVHAGLVIRWQDLYDRTLRQQAWANIALPAKGEIGIDFVFPFRETQAAFHEIVASLSMQDSKIDEKRKPFFVPQRDLDDYKLILWHADSAAVHITHFLEPRALRELGVDFLDCQPHHISDARIIMNMRAGMQITYTNIRRVTLLGNFKECEKDLIRKPCFSDPAGLDWLGKALVKSAKRLARFSPLFYHLGDECSMTSYSAPLDICFSPYCLTAMRVWLKEQYGTLKNLNRGWDTHFASWEEVRPMTTKEVLARKGMNFAPWADHRTFNDIVYARMSAYAKQVIRGFDPEARYGECGTSGYAAYGGHDWARLMKIWDLVTSYYAHKNQGEMQRSFRRPGARISSWAGFRKTREQIRDYWWERLLYGEDCASIWWKPVVMNPDFTPTVIGGAVREYIRDEIKKGVGRMIKKSTWSDDGIAVFYSPPSVQAAYILKNRYGYDTETMGFDNTTDTMNLLKDLGLQYSFISSARIVRGDLMTKKYRLLVLPLAWAISRETAKQIRAFAEAGGVVLADLQCGIFDEHLHPHKTPILDDLFGIHRRSLPAKHEARQLVYRNLSCRTALSEDLSASGPVSGSLVEPGLAVGELMVREGNKGRPAVIVTSVGKGKAVYLNFLTDYTSRRKVAREEPMRRIAAKIMKQCGITARVSMERIADSKPCRAMVVCRSRGDHTYLGIFGLRATNPLVGKKVVDLKADAGGARIRLWKRFHVYNVRTHAYLGQTDRIMARKLPGPHTRLFALLPGKINAIDFSLKKTEYSQGETGEGLVRIDGPGDFVVRLECFGPDNKPIECFTRNLDAIKGEACFSLPLAFNEQPGTYRLVAKEIISGLSKEVIFKIGDKP